MNTMLHGNALLALAAAALWGGSDFCGGMGVKRVEAVCTAVCAWFC